MSYILMHDVTLIRGQVNTMEHDVSPHIAQDALLGVVTTITQSDIAPLRIDSRLGEFAVVYRCWRTQMGGGFGDQQKHPYAWGVLVYVDGQLARIWSARAQPREWSNLDRLEKWLRMQGFHYWWTRNDLEVLGEESDDLGIGDAENEQVSNNMVKTPELPSSRKALSAFLNLIVPR